MKEYNPEIMNAANHYLWAIAECYSLVAILFVFRNTLQGLGFTYANMIAGAGEFLEDLPLLLYLQRLLDLTQFVMQVLLRGFLRISR